MYFCKFIRTGLVRILSVLHLEFLNSDLTEETKLKSYVHVMYVSYVADT